MTPRPPPVAPWAGRYGLAIGPCRVIFLRSGVGSRFNFVARRHYNTAMNSETSHAESDEIVSKRGHVEKPPVSRKARLQRSNE